MNQFEKDKLTLARITGLAIDQEFVLTDQLSDRPLTGITRQSATEDAFRSRSDLASAEASVRAAEFSLRAEKGERLPTVSFQADYGAGGANIGNFNQVYSIAGSVSVPIFTGGRIRADIRQAQADLARREAEKADLEGRIAYDIRVAWLDLNASNSSVKVAGQTRPLESGARAVTGSLPERRDELSRSCPGSGGGCLRKRELYPEPLFIQRREDFPVAGHGRFGNAASRVIRREMK